VLGQQNIREQQGTNKQNDEIDNVFSKHTVKQTSSKVMLLTSEITS
jgi:hypothetical protein